MAIINLSQILSALPQGFDDQMTVLWNRQARVLQAITVKPGHGINAAWIVSSAAKAAYAYADGYDVQLAEFDSDIQVPAVLPWAQYRGSFGLTQKMLDVTASSRGGSADLLDMFAEKIYETSTTIVSKLSADFFAGAGTSDTLQGVANSLLASGSYAGLSISTYPQLASNVTTAAGALTLAMMTSMDTKIFNKSNLAYDLIVCDPATHEKYSNLAIGVVNTVQGIIGGKLNLSVSDQNVTFKGISVVRDKDLAAGTMLFLNTSYLHFKALPMTPVRDSAIYQAVSATDGVSAIGIPLMISALAKTGPSQKFSVSTPSMQLCVTRPNAHGIITGIS